MSTYGEKKSITLALTGASGAPYGLRVLECLLAQQVKVYLLISSAARAVLTLEHNTVLPADVTSVQAMFCQRFGCSPDLLTVCDKEDWLSPVASGSAAPKQMVICPCSSGSLSAIAHGGSDNLIERAADVVIKERGQLILVVRETPYSSIHLENMHKLSLMGVTIMPASPGFYHHPESIEDMVDFMVARILDHLGVDQTLVPGWGINA